MAESLYGGTARVVVLVDLLVLMYHGIAMGNYLSAARYDDRGGTLRATEATLTSAKGMSAVMEAHRRSADLSLRPLLGEGG